MCSRLARSRLDEMAGPYCRWNRSSCYWNGCFQKIDEERKVYDEYLSFLLRGISNFDGQVDGRTCGDGRLQSVKSSTGNLDDCDFFASPFWMMLRSYFSISRISLFASGHKDLLAWHIYYNALFEFHTFRITWNVSCHHSWYLAQSFKMIWRMDLHQSICYASSTVLNGSTCCGSQRHPEHL